MSTLFEVIGDPSRRRMLDLLRDDEHTVNELVDALRRKDRHLRLEPGPADGLHQLGISEVAAEHLARRVPHGREDDPAGIDDGAVEIEEDDRKTDHWDPS